MVIRWYGLIWYVLRSPLRPLARPFIFDASIYHAEDVIERTFFFINPHIHTSFFKVIAKPPRRPLMGPNEVTLKNLVHVYIYRYTVDILQCSLIYQQTTLTSPLKEFHPLSQLHPESFTSLLKSNMISTFGIATLNKVNGCRFHLKMSLKHHKFWSSSCPFHKDICFPNPAYVPQKSHLSQEASWHLPIHPTFPPDMQQRNTLGFGYNFSIGICQLLQAPVNFGQKCNKMVMASAKVFFSWQGW